MAFEEVAVSGAGRLALGTAAVGLDAYGIANRTGKPSRAAAFEMFDRAFGGGVRWVDTAAAYGDAEALLGEYGLPKGVRVSSKLRPNLFDADESPAEIRATVLREALVALERLRVDHFDAYLLHSTRYVGRPDVTDALLDLRGGLARRVGVSCYEPAEIDAAIAAGLDVVQAPYSVLDRRCEAAMARARARGLLVFARAPFLQGLLVLSPSAVPERLAHVRPHVERWHVLADVFWKYSGRRNISAELALEFALQNPYADYVVFGAETPEQVDEDVAVAAAPRVRGVRRSVQAAVPQADAAVVNPSLWAKREPGVIWSGR